MVAQRWYVHPCIRLCEWPAFRALGSTTKFTSCVTGAHGGGYYSQTMQTKQKLPFSARSARYQNAVKRRMHKGLGRRHEPKRVSTPVFASAKRVEQRVTEKLMSKFSRVQQAFRAFDTNKNGFISKDEVRHCLTPCPVAVSVW